MDDTHTSSPSEFVVHLSKEVGYEVVQSALEKLGSIDMLPAAPNSFLLRLRIPSSNTRETWKTALQQIHVIDANAAIAPVLLDPNGDARYPLGTIGVRFKEAPTDQDLSAFCTSHGMVLKKKNRYVPTQMTLQPLDTDTFLPDLLARFKQSAPQVSVWPETLSQYRRV